jgi:hypothetical protein
MNRSRSLPRLVRWAVQRFDEFEHLADQLRTPFSRADANTVRYLAIEAVNTWALFMRSYYLASATGAWLADGTRVTGPGVQGDQGRALTASVLAVNRGLRRRGGPWRQRNEPNWMDPAIINRLMTANGLSNARGFTNALGIGTGANFRLITFRNFVAHRGRESAVKVRRMIRQVGIRSSSDPLELPFHRIPGRPVTAITDWLIELHSIVESVPN